MASLNADRLDEEVHAHRPSFLPSHPAGSTWPTDRTRTLRSPTAAISAHEAHRRERASSLRHNAARAALTNEQLAHAERSSAQSSESNGRAREGGPRAHPKHKGKRTRVAITGCCSSVIPLQAQREASRAYGRGKNAHTKVAHGRGKCARRAQTRARSSLHHDAARAALTNEQLAHACGAAKRAVEREQQQSVRAGQRAVRSPKARGQAQDGEATTRFRSSRKLLLESIA